MLTRRSLSAVALSNLKPPNFCERERECAGEEERKTKECVPPLQFGEIYEWTKPKSVRVYTQREFGRRDLRSAAWVIIQSSCSHISHFESHRLWEGTDLSYTQVAHVQAPKSKEKQKKTKKNKTRHAHNLVRQMLFHFRGNMIHRYCKPGKMMTLNYCAWLPQSIIVCIYQSVSEMKAKAQFIYHQRLFS